LQEASLKLPLLLIHGYNSGPDVWYDEWLPKLPEDGIRAEAVRFPIDDDCGSSQSHAQQLETIVENFKAETGSDKINIVAHSKGGLDARLYLSNNPSSDDVSKLIMIGTPNLGSPAAALAKYNAAIVATFYPVMYPYLEAFLCFPALDDLVPGSPASAAEINENTEYYTIAGDWRSNPYFTPFDLIPVDSNCPPTSWLPFQRWTGDYVIGGEDDGIVPLSSAASEEFENIGVTNNCHTNLFEIDEEYEIVKEKLLP
jgi:pimeloyl-ACP methyl ester carboxylesterase